MSKQGQKPSKLELVQVAGNIAVWIPPHSPLMVQVETLSTLLKGRPRVATILVDASIQVMFQHPADQPNRSRGQPDAQDMPGYSTYYSPASRSDCGGAVGADCQEVSSETLSRAVQQQNTLTLPNEVVLENFPEDTDT